MSQNESWWSIREEDIPICSAYTLCVPWTHTRHLSPPSMCPSFGPVHHVWWKRHRCCCSHWEVAVGMLLTAFPWCSGCDRDHSGKDFSTRLSRSNRHKSFLQPEFLMQRRIQLPYALFAALCCCVIHVSHVSCPKQQFTVVNRHPCHWAGISPSVPLWAAAEADDLLEVENMSPGFITSSVIVSGPWLLPSLLFQPIESSLL